MTVTMIAVVSLDGCLTRHTGAGASGWASPEDQARYKALSGACDVQLLGAGTYREHREAFQRSARNGPSKLILTRTPETFANDVVPGHLEFTAEQPAALIARLRSEGRQRIGVLGGSQVYRDYLAADVVDELYLTLEPVVFGQGIRLAGDAPIDVRFRLRDIEKLNPSTLLLTYDRS